MGNTSSRKIKVIFWNGNDDRRNKGFEGEAFPEYATKNRLDGIVKTIKEKTVENTLFCLFEMEENTCKQIMQSLNLDLITKTEYAMKMVAYNTSLGAFNFLLIALNPELVENVQPLPLTESGQSYDNSKRPQAPKQGETPSDEFIKYKQEILKDNFDKMLVKVSIGNLDIYFTHLGLATDARFLQTSKIAQYITEHSINTQRLWMFGGDLNCFDPNSSTPTLYAPQMDLLKGMGGNWLTAETKSTFNAFKFDVAFKMSKEEKDKYFGYKDRKEVAEFRKFCLEMAEKYGTEGGPLDHVFTSANLTAAVTAHPPTELSDHSLVETEIALF